VLWRYTSNCKGIIEAENEMTSKSGFNRLLHDLHELYYKLSAIDLRKRMSLYHRNTATRNIPDIATELTARFDKLAAAGKSHGATADPGASNQSSAVPVQPDEVKQSSSQSPGIMSMVSAFIRPKKVFTQINITDQHLGEKLKQSTLTHMHTAMLQARQGNAANAKLHADIANNALHEAAHYLSEEDYEGLCREVAETFKELGV